MEDRQPTLADIGAALTRAVRLMTMNTPPLQAPVPPSGIREEDWVATPVAVRVLVTELVQRVARLEARRKPTSRNSSTSPASAPPRAKPRSAQEP
jgi:hypothetical protein